MLRSPHSAPRSALGKRWSSKRSRIRLPLALRLPLYLARTFLGRTRASNITTWPDQQDTLQRHASNMQTRLPGLQKVSLRNPAPGTLSDMRRNAEAQRVALSTTLIETECPPIPQKIRYFDDSSFIISSIQHTLLADITEAQLFILSYIYNHHEALYCPRRPSSGHRAD